MVFRRLRAKHIALAQVSGTIEPDIDDCTVDVVCQVVPERGELRCEADVVVAGVEISNAVRIRVVGENGRARQHHRSPHPDPARQAPTSKAATTIPHHGPQ